MYELALWLLWLLGFCNGVSIVWWLGRIEGVDSLPGNKSTFMVAGRCKACAELDALLELSWRLISVVLLFDIDVIWAAQLKLRAEKHRNVKMTRKTKDIDARMFIFLRDLLAL